MKQKFLQTQKFNLKLTPTLLNQINILSLTGRELRNELIKIVEIAQDEEDNKELVNKFRDQILIDSYINFVNPQKNQEYESIQLSTETTLQEKLSEQFSFLGLKEHQFLIGEYLIDSIQENGQLDPDIDYNDIKSIVLTEFKLAITTKEIEEILRKVQNLDPVGCGYRKITESLLVQIDHLDIDRTKKKNIKKIILDISSGLITLKDIGEENKTLIRDLNFSPGYLVDSVKNSYINPDVIALRGDKKWEVTLNDSFMSQALIEKIKDKMESSSNNKSEESKSIVRGIERRQKTLLLISSFLVLKQKKYLDGKGGLSPLTLSDIAKDLKLHESTISRIVNFNYIQLPSKVILLKNLLERKVNTKPHSKSISPSALKSLISKIISKEDKFCPMTDNKIKEILLTKHSIDLSRRVICKYRQKAKISSVKHRVRSI